MDSPAIEFHPFGTITLNFDDQPIKLRRCRLGDLEFAKNLLEQLRVDTDEQRLLLLQDANERQAAIREIMGVTDDEGEAPPIADEERNKLQELTKELNDIARQMDGQRVEIIYGWLNSVIERMGDGKPPQKDDWPLDLLEANIPAQIIGHWQTRPLASGRNNPNGTPPVADRSPQSPPTPSSLPVPPLQ